MELDRIYIGDCMDFLKRLDDKAVDFTLTDIPYGEVNRDSNGLRALDKKDADILNFPLQDFLKEVYRVTKNNVCIFCGREQFSEIYSYFAQKEGTVRPIVWEKTNPSPMNGEFVYLSGVEFAVWFKKKGSKTFNAFCKNTVFRYPSGDSSIHPTSKNVKLFEQLILDNTNPEDVVLDTCMGGGTTAFACIELSRHFIGFELNEEYVRKTNERLQQVQLKFF